MTPNPRTAATMVEALEDAAYEWGMHRRDSLRDLTLAARAELLEFIEQAAATPPSSRCRFCGRHTDRGRDGACDRDAGLRKDPDVDWVAKRQECEAIYSRRRAEDLAGIDRGAVAEDAFTTGRNSYSADKNGVYWAPNPHPAGTVAALWFSRGQLAAIHSKEISDDELDEFIHIATNFPAHQNRSCAEDRERATHEQRQRFRAAFRAIGRKA